MGAAIQPETDPALARRQALSRHDQSQECPAAYRSVQTSGGRPLRRLQYDAAAAAAAEEGQLFQSCNRGGRKRFVTSLAAG